MLDIKDIGEEIASRDLELVFEDGRREKAKLRIGKPFENKEMDAWCCPYELISDTYRKTFGMVGYDSIQALQLTMKTLKVETEYCERKLNGRFFFLDEEGSGV